MIESTAQNIPYDFTLFEEDNTVDVSLFDTPIAFDSLTPASDKLMAAPVAAPVPRQQQPAVATSTAAKGHDGFSALFGDLGAIARSNASISGSYSAPTPANALLDTPFTPFLETPSLDSPLDTPLPALEHDFGPNQLQQAQLILFDGLFPEMSADPMAFGFLPEPKQPFTVNPQSVFPDLLFGSSSGSTSCSGATAAGSVVMTQQSQTPLVDSLPLALFKDGEQSHPVAASFSPATAGGFSVSFSETSSLSSASSSPSMVSEHDFEDDPADWDYLPGSKRKSADASAVRPVKKPLLPCPIAPLSSRKPSNAPRRFECSFPGCDRRFARLYNLNTHEKTHDPAKARPFPCPACTKCFSRKHDLQRHVTGVHLGERNFACTTCERTFSRHDGLRRHLSAPGACYEAARVVT